MEITKKKGLTTIIIDTSYVDNRTEEQERADFLRLTDAVWSMYEELDEAV